MPEWGSKVAMQSLHTQLSHLTQVSLDGLHQINDTLIRALYSQISPEEHTHCQKQLRDIIEVKHRLEQIARQIDISRFR